MKKITVSIVLIGFIIVAFGSCKNVIQPKQEWLNNIPNKISVTDIGMSSDINPQKYEKTINQLKMIEIIGKTPKKPNAVDGGSFGIVLEYNEQKVIYSFNHYLAENSEKNKYLIFCTVNDKSVFAGEITNNVYREMLELLKIIIQ